MFKSLGISSINEEQLLQVEKLKSEIGELRDALYQTEFTSDQKIWTLGSGHESPTQLPQCSIQQKLFVPTSQY
jgi:hypothetical protein